MIPQIQRRALRLARRNGLDSAIAALEPLCWLSLREASGSIARNRAYTGGVSADLLGGAGSFASGSGWTPTAQWSIGSGVASYNDSANGDLAFNGNLGLSAGDSLRADFRIVTGGAQSRIRWHNGAGQTIIGDKLLPVGSHQIDVIAPFAISTGFLVRADAGSTSAPFTLDDYAVFKTGEIDALLAGGISLNQTGAQGASQAFAIDGSTGVARLYNRASIQGMGAFTLSQLIKPDTLADGDYLWFKADEIEVWLNANGSIFARAHFSTTDAETSSAAGVISAGTWAFVHVVLDDSDDTLYVYVNDALINDSVQAGAGSRVSNTNDLLLWKNASTNGFDGLVDEVFLRDSARSATDLTAIAHALGLV